MAQVTLENSTGRSPIFILALIRSCTDRAAHFTPKNSTGRSPICFWCFFGHVPTEWLKLPLNTAQDARNFFFVFYGPLGSEAECVLLLALSWPKGPVKFFAYVAPKGVMLFDSNVRFK